MNIFQFIGTKKLNELILTGDYVTGSTTQHDVSKGPDRYSGLLGSKYTFSEKEGLKLSNTTLGTIYGCTIQLVRIQPDFGTVLLTDIIVGRPLYWNDTKKFFVTPLATATSRLAGISICKLTSANLKGDIIPIVTFGDVGVLMAAAITKSSPTINDPITAAIGSSLAAADVLADATAWTNVQLALRMGRLLEALGSGGDAEVHKMYLDAAYQIPDPGIKN